MGCNGVHGRHRSYGQRRHRSSTVRYEDAILCLLYTSDAADERSSVDLGGRRIIKKKKNEAHVVDAIDKIKTARDRDTTKSTDEKIEDEKS